MLLQGITQQWNYSAVKLLSSEITQQLNYSAVKLLSGVFNLLLGQTLFYSAFL